MIAVLLYGLVNEKNYNINKSSIDVTVVFLHHLDNSMVTWHVYGKPNFSVMASLALVRYLPCYLVLLVNVVDRDSL